MSNISVFSFFSGSGFLDLGFEKSGFEIVYVNEFFKPFLEAYTYSRHKLGIPGPKHGYFSGSITECLEGNEAKRLKHCLALEKSEGKTTGFIGGPPCPDFSIGGKNKGHEGENGKLSQSYVDLILNVTPDFFIFENVKGLWRTKRHKDFYEKLKKSLQKKGYLLTEKLINALEYGVPQDRERIILFGINKKILLNTITEEKVDTLFHWDNATVFSRQEIKELTSKKASLLDNAEIPEQLTVQHWFDKNNVKNHPNAKHCFVPRAGLEKFKIIAEGDDSKKSYKRLHRFRYSPTAAYGNNEVHIHPVEPRRINAAEALAIQSLPKEFELPQHMTLTNMFKTIGNGVPFLAALGIAKTVFQFLEANCHENNSK